MIKKSVEDDRRSVGVPPAVAGTSRPRFGEITIRDRGRLPHWEKDSATYFITFRWSDSLPNALLAKIESERKSIVDNANQIGRELSPDERKRLQNLSTSRIENDLDTGAGACYLFDDIRYRLLGWCGMPNHVHVVLRLSPGQRWPRSSIPGNLAAQKKWAEFSGDRAPSGNVSTTTTSSAMKMSYKVRCATWQRIQ